MTTLRNERKLAAVAWETQEEHPSNGQSRNTSVPTINEVYITQVSEEIENRVTRKLSREFSRTESRILGALSELDEFLLSQQVRTHSRTVPGTFRNTNLENREPNEDHSRLILILKWDHPSISHVINLIQTQTMRLTIPRNLFTESIFGFLNYPTPLAHQQIKFSICPRHFKDRCKVYWLHGNYNYTEWIKQTSECSGRFDELTRFFHSA